MTPDDKDTPSMVIVRSFIQSSVGISRLGALGSIDHVFDEIRDKVLGRAEVHGYPIAGQGETEGDATEIECPSCGVGNDVSREYGLVHPGDYECMACDAPFEVTDVVVYCRARKT